MQNPSLTASPISPTNLFLIVLAAIALAEVGVMLSVHRLLPKESTPLWVYIALDATALVLICLPMLWYLILRPLRRAAERSWRSSPPAAAWR